MEGRKITNCKQFETLVQLMEKNREIARGYMNFGSSKEEYNSIWNEFADKLNSLGPPVRINTEWQKVWNDYKAKIKSKLAHNKKELSATGGGTNKLYTFSTLEDSVIDILLLKEVSQPSRKTFGLNNSNNEPLASSSTDPTTSCAAMLPDVTEYQIDEFDSLTEVDTNRIQVTLDTAPHQSTQRKKSKKSFEDERRCFLEVQTKSIQEIEKHTKEIGRYFRKLYEVKLKKLELYKENLREKKTRKEMLELKLRTIEYKEKKLALQENYQSP